MLGSEILFGTLLRARANVQPRPYLLLYISAVEFFPTLVLTLLVRLSVQILVLHQQVRKSILLQRPFDSQTVYGTVMQKFKTLPQLDWLLHIVTSSRPTPGQ